MKNLHLAIDVFYQNNRANAVGVLFEDWSQAEPNSIITALIDGVENYEPGNFYKRELPCVLNLLEKVDLSTIDCIVVDGYVYLNKEGREGLGYHLYEALNKQVPVIGVAKNYFHDTDATPLYRGDSKKPLYVTSIGIEREDAVDKISSMHGEYRFPTLLKFLDQQTKLPEAFL